MPQALLPLVPDGASSINDRISVIRENGHWTYLCGVDAVFRHPEDERQAFRMFTAQLVCQGACRQVDIVRAFGVSANSVKRSVKKYREEGVAGFYRPQKRRGPTVLVDDVLAQAQDLLSRGSSRGDVADQLEVRYDTIRKAINQGRLRESTLREPAPCEPAPCETADPPEKACDKSQRSVKDARAVEQVGG